MPVNKYFNNLYAVNEQDTYGNLVYEMIQLYGVDIVYIKREFVELDPVLREPKKSSFRETYIIESYLPDTGQGGGDQSIMSKFGFRFNETTEAIISIKAWDRTNTGLKRPREGDIIYIGNPEHIYRSFMNEAYDIKQVHLGAADEYQKGGQYTYRLVLESFTPSYETFETEYDQINDRYNVDDDFENLTTINKHSKEETDNLLVPSKNPFGEI